MMVEKPSYLLGCELALRQLQSLKKGETKLIEVRVKIIFVFVGFLVNKFEFKCGQPMKLV